MSTVLHVGRVISGTTAEGPGTRFAVWVQGCSLHCAGCFNPHLWNPSGGQEISASELARRALAADVEGVTLMGGEPFEQASGMGEFAELVHRGGLSVMTLTGYLLGELRERHDPDVDRLLAHTDLLIDGPYQADQRDTERPWVGSRNQRFWFLSERYRHLQDTLSAEQNRIELRIRPDGSVSVNGWAPDKVLETLLDVDDVGLDVRRTDL